MAASMKMAVFWVVMLCGVVEVYQCFRLLLSPITWVMEAGSAFEMLVKFCQTTWYYNPEGNHLHMKTWF
jgi:hypothetical protein